MAEYTPPTDDVPIFDVSNFISSSGAGLTEAQIATKFLRYPTGQGTETLPELITGTITAPNTMDIVMPNTSSTNVLNVGVVSRNIAGQIHHYSDGDNCVAGAGVHINNGINNASNTNIHNGATSTGIVNIMSGASSTGTVNIGQPTTTNSIKGTTTILGSTSINTSGGSNTIIGANNLGAVTVKGLSITLSETPNVNIQTTPISDNTKSTTIGTTNGSFSTLTTINGRLTTTGVTNINTSGTANTNIGIIGSTTTVAGATNINTSGTATTALGIQSSTINIRGGVNINTNGTGGYSGTTIGVAGSVTAINGTTNINTSGGSTTTIGTVNSGISAINGATVNIGNADTLTIMNGTNIKQVIKTIDNTLIENVVGNTSIVPSMSTTFNRKYLTPVVNAVSVFAINANAVGQFTSQYFEIYISGCNAGRGSYTYKGCFGVEKIDTGNMTASSVTTLFYFGTGISPPTTSVIPEITFATTQQQITVVVNTSGGNSTDINFIATLTSFPTCSRRASAPQLEDFLITAV